jgi:hypothetical protein
MHLQFHPPFSQTEKSQIGIGLRRITDEMWDSLEGIIENSEMPDQGMIAVKIERSPYFLSDFLDRNSLALKLMLLILKKMHRSSQAVRSNLFRRRLMV